MNKWRDYLWWEMSIHSFSKLYCVYVSFKTKGYGWHYKCLLEWGPTHNLKPEVHVTNDDHEGVMLQQHLGGHIGAYTLLHTILLKVM